MFLFNCLLCTCTSIKHYIYVFFINFYIIIIRNDGNRGAFINKILLNCIPKQIGVFSFDTEFVIFSLYRLPKIVTSGNLCHNIFLFVYIHTFNIRRICMLHLWIKYNKIIYERQYAPPTTTTTKITLYRIIIIKH